MRGKSFWAAVAMLVAGAIFAPDGGAATMRTVTLTVNSTADSTTPCVIANHKSTGTCTLRGAILAANALGHDNTMFVIKLAAKKYRLNQGTLVVAASTASTANIVQIVGKAGKRGRPASVINGSGNSKPASVFVIASPTQMSSVVITGGSGNPNYTCTDSDAGCGGGVWLQSALDLQHSVVRGNTACSAWTGTVCTGAYTHGGGIFMPDDGHQELLTLYKTTVKHNVAVGGGGIFNDDRQSSSTVLISRSHIDGNTACQTFSNGVCSGGGFGGGVTNNGDNVTFDHSTVNGNVAGSPSSGSGDGGGIDQVNGNMQLYHTTVSGNVAGAYGGGIDGDMDVAFVDSTVSHNLAGVYGGGLGLRRKASFKNTTFSSNTAGGTFACTIDGGTTTCHNTVKTTTGDCATLYPTATQCVSSNGYGGGIYSSAADPQFISSTVTKNVAVSTTGSAVNCGGGQGGGVWSAWTLSAIAGTKITGNSADCGGGIYNLYVVEPAFTFALANSTISGNTALEDGGAIWTEGAGTGTLYGMTITGNHAGHKTGGVWDDQLGSVLLGVGNNITMNTSPHTCKNVTLPCK